MQKKRTQRNLAKKPDAAQKNNDFKIILDASLEGIIQIDSKGNIELFNLFAQRLFGYSEKEIINNNINLLIEEDYSKNNTEFLNIIKSPKKNISLIGRQQELEARHKDGGYIPISININLIENNHRSFFVAIVNDITEQKKSEERIKQYTDRIEWAYFEMQSARREADKANQAKSLFLANMSHEIRTPLNGIMGMAELMMNTNLNEKQIHYLNRIYSSSEMLLEIINDILDFSKIEAGEMRLSPLPSDIRDILEEVADLFTQKAKEKNIYIKYTVEESIPNNIMFDTLRIKQILVNLIGNAVKFTDKGGINIIVTKKSSPQAKIKLRFDIKDTGIGIQKEKQSIIFDKFAQADASTTKKFGGTGLGLAICKQLVENLMKGSIGVESELGKGSNFWFEIILPIDKK